MMILFWTNVCRDCPSVFSSGIFWRKMRRFETKGASWSAAYSAATVMAGLRSAAQVSGEEMPMLVRAEAGASPQLCLAIYDQLCLQSASKAEITPLQKRSYEGDGPSQSKRPAVQAQVERLLCSSLNDKGHMGHEEKIKIAFEHFLARAAGIAKNFSSEMKKVLDEVKHAEASSGQNENMQSKSDLEKKINDLSREKVDLQAMLMAKEMMLEAEVEKREEAESKYASLLENKGGEAVGAQNPIDLNADIMINVDAEEMLLEGRTVRLIREE